MEPRNRQRDASGARTAEARIEDAGPEEGREPEEDGAQGGASHAGGEATQTQSRGKVT